jgi:hypothetical protein
MLAGLRTLIQTGHGPIDRRPTHFDTMPSAPSRQACAKDGRTILCDALVDQDSRPHIAQQCQRGLAVEKRAIPQILAVAPRSKAYSIELCGRLAAQLVEA